MKVKSEVKSLSRVQLSATPWTAAHQAPPSVGFSKSPGVPLYEVSKIARLIKTLSRVVVARGRRERNGEMLLSGHKVLVMYNE